MMVSVTRALLLLVLPSVALGKGRRLASTPSLHSDDAAAASGQPTAFTLKSRVYIPYNNQATGLGFGMGAAEQIAYDDVEKYGYAISEQGYINVIDWNLPSAPTVMTLLAVDLAGKKLTDIEICTNLGVFFVGAGADDTVSNGKVHVFHTVKRADPMMPTQITEITVGPLPDMLLPNSACTKVAVANEGEGDYDSGLVDPEGSVMIISSTNFSSVTPTVETISLSTYTDEQLKAMGVHLPLEEKAMEYWDDHSHLAGDLDFSTARASYSSGMNLEPEYLAWSYDETTLFVNLQENNAVASISVPASGSASLEGIHGLGMKDHGTVQLDIVEDGACNFATYAGLHALRMPDAIQAIQVDCVDYVITANEGDDKGYGDWEEKWKLKDLIDSDLTMDSDIMNMSASTAAQATANLIHTVDSGSLRITVGSSAVNYSDPMHPVIENIVVFGGRGMSIYKYENSGLTLHWDSEHHFEKNQCDNYAWAHNAIQDEEFAPLYGALYNSSGSGMRETLEDMNDPDEDGCEDGGNGNPGACPLGQTVDERSLKDGAGTEAVVAGVACGRLIAVTATEKQGTAFVYDVTNPSAPELLFVQHLSTASETKNPGVAYADGTLGEIDAEAMIFLDACHSPTSKAGIMFGGAWSGTMSFWEFTCPASWTDDCDHDHDHDHCGDTTDDSMTDSGDSTEEVGGADRTVASLSLFLLTAFFAPRV
mmetsp:Transcript_32235/g.58932  ORF Transcript_32235/g.58932 Transcript_32235/m.58932 type:complete len:708 (-) Transcript_32235:157-2280(-)